MADSDPRRDEQWLAALAGRPDPAADPALNRQAAALRKALAAQKAAIEARTPKADDALYEQIRFRLRREGVGGSGTGWRQPRYWALAASLALAAGLVVQVGLFAPPADEDFLVVRGGQRALVQVVADPEARLAELLAGLRAAGAKPEVKKDRAGRVRIAVARTEPVVEYLLEERLGPLPPGGEIVIVLEKSGPPGR